MVAVWISPTHNTPSTSSYRRHNAISYRGLHIPTIDHPLLYCFTKLGSVTGNDDACLHSRKYHPQRGSQRKNKFWVRISEYALGVSRTWTISLCPPPFSVGPPPLFPPLWWYVLVHVIGRPGGCLCCSCAHVSHLSPPPPDLGRPSTATLYNLPLGSSISLALYLCSGGHPSLFLASCQPWSFCPPSSVSLVFQPPPVPSPACLPVPPIFVFFLCPPPPLTRLRS